MIGERFRSLWGHVGGIMSRRKPVGIAVALAVVMIAGGAIIYTRIYRARQESAEPTITTAQVEQGDLIVSVSGSGTLAPTSEVSLGFQEGGIVDEILVEVGDQVQQGDVLARLKTDDLVVAVSKAEVEAQLAQLELADAMEGPSDAELADARASLRSAQTALAVAQYGYSSTLNSDLDSAVRSRAIEFQWTVERYWETEQSDDPGPGKLEETWGDWTEAEARLGDAAHQAEMEELEAENELDQARNRVLQAWDDYTLLASRPATDTLLQAQMAAARAQLALEDAQEALEAASLRAPFAGTVVEVTAIPGEHVETGAIVTLADLEEPLLQFWVEESDMGGVEAGKPVQIAFEALPDDIFGGEIVQVEPALVTVDNLLAVQAWASIDLSSSQHTRLLGGMNADVEVILAEARDTLLVPLEALRELESDLYAVFVVGDDGELEMRPVEVGLQDYVSAQILSGLEAGETVSTGIRDDTVVSDASGEEQMPGPGVPMMGPMFGGR